MYETLKNINEKPAVFGTYTADALWTDDHRSQQMLKYHLNETVDVSSRNIAFIDASASWMIDRFDLRAGKSVCDFGCGPGLYTSRLVRSDAQITGLDFSETSIRYARQQADAARHNLTYIHCDYLTFESAERFDLVTMIMCDYCALNPMQRARLLKSVYTHLKSDGAFLLDVYSMAAFAARAPASGYERNQLDHFWSASDYFCFVNTFKYDEEAVVLDKYSVFPEAGPPETIYNWLQYFSPETLGEELRAAGLVPQHMYNDVNGAGFSKDNTEFAIVARKAS